MPLSGAWVGVVLAVSLAGNGLLGWYVLHLHEAIGLAEAQAEQCYSQVRAQNAAVESWQAVALEQAELMQAAGVRAARVRTVTQVKVLRVMQEPVPTECDEAVEWAADWGRERGRQWAGD